MGTASLRGMAPLPRPSDCQDRMMHSREGAHDQRIGQRHRRLGHAHGRRRGYRDGGRAADHFGRGLRRPHLVARSLPVARPRAACRVRSHQLVWFRRRHARCAALSMAPSSAPGRTASQAARVSTLRLAVDGSSRRGGRGYVHRRCGRRARHHHLQPRARARGRALVAARRAGAWT